MRTDDLIAALAADTTPPPRPARRLAGAMVLALAASAAGLTAFWGTRSGLGEVLASPLLAKTVGPALLAIVALVLAMALIRPAQRVGVRAGVLVGILAVLGVWLGLAVSDAGMAGLGMAWGKPSLWICLVSVPTFALAPLAAILWSMSAGAPTRPGVTGAVAGLAAGGFGAATYSLYCDVDMAIFVLPAYGTGIAVVAGIGAVLGNRLLRW